jgi:uncharacterized membrane protein
MKQYLKTFILTIALTASLATGITAGSVAAQSTADYSCGTYGAGNYSQGGCTANVTVPNTGFGGFEKLAQPSYFVPIGLSLLAITVGLVLLLRKRKRAISLGGSR